MIDCSLYAPVATKKIKDAGENCFPHTRMTSSKLLLMISVGILKLVYQYLIFIESGLKSHCDVLLSQLLLSAVYHISGELLLQQDFFLAYRVRQFSCINISQNSVVQICDGVVHLASINVVNRHWARLLLGWVTV